MKKTPLLYLGLLFCALFTGIAADDIPITDTDAVKKYAIKYIAEGNYEGLDELAEKCAKQKYEILNFYPAIFAFYDALRPPDGATDAQINQRQQELERWVASQPKSLSARIALSDFYIYFAWKARGIGWANTVTEDGWKLFKERLERAKSILEGVKEDEVADPQYYQSGMTIALGLGSRALLEHYYANGVKKFENCYPLYNAKAYFLMPRWHGQPGDSEKFAYEVSKRFSGDEDDAFYAEVCRNKANMEGKDYFRISKANLPAIERGLHHLKSIKPDKDQWVYLNQLAIFSWITNQQEKLTTYLCEMGRNAWWELWGTYMDYEGSSLSKGNAGKEVYDSLWESTGLQTRWDAAMKFEEEGRLDEAEEAYTTLDPSGNANVWKFVIMPFYVRLGMLSKAGDVVNDERLDIVPQTAGPMQAFLLARVFLMSGDDEKARAMAERFDSLRPFNISGKIVIYGLAVSEKDPAKLEAARKRFTDLKTDRPSYVLAQNVMKGEKSWEEAKGQFNYRDDYYRQGLTVLALYFVEKGDPASAKEALDLAEKAFLRSSVEMTFVESMQRGSLARRYQLR